MAQSNEAHTEIELKLLLDGEQAYGTLRRWLDTHGDVQVAVQSNRYLDTTDRAFGRRRMMLRVRLAGDKVTCTAKAGARMIDGVMQVSEWEQRLDDERADAWRRGLSSCELGALPISAALIAGPLHDLQEAAQRSVHVIGVMQTTRRAYGVPSAALGLAGEEIITLELDHSLFPAGQERFELEVEHPDAGALKNAMTTLLDGLQITWWPADTSKYEQFLHAQDMAPGLDGEGDGGADAGGGW